MSTSEANHIATLKQNSENIATYTLPELPEADAQSIYERISEQEARIASPDLSETGYRIGTATVDNEIYEVKGRSSGLLTAEHATDQMRKGARKEADWGVAGLGQVVHEDTDVNFLATRGRQTGDPNFDVEHPFKSAIRTLMIEERPLVVAGLHGMASGKFNGLTDVKAFDILLGIGNNPSEQSQKLAEAVRAIAQDLGLKAGVNQAFIKKDQGLAARKEDGTFARNNFKAAGENTTRSLEQRVAEEHGLDSATLQVELSGLLRRLPEGLEFDSKSRVMGAYLGYLVVRGLVETSANV